MFVLFQSFHSTQLPVDEIFRNLPDNWRRFCSPLSVSSNVAVHSSWAVSYTSGNSFYENKYGRAF